jgi:hypothetical protein
MASRSGRIIILAGPSEAASLDHRDSILLDDFIEPVRRFLGKETSSIVAAATPTTSSTPPKWRSLKHIPNSLGKERTNQIRARPAQFLSFSEETRDDAASPTGPEDFLEHSMAVLDNIDSSQLQPTSDNNTQNSTIFPTTSMSLTDTSSDPSVSFLTDSPPTTAILNVGSNCSITELKGIQPASHISAIHPQTITLNIVVGIITVSALRTVSLRRRNAEMDIIELTVGDETRAGFNITFWLTPVESQQRNQANDELRHILTKRRSGDLILIRNVALSCFRGAVYGQSLPQRRFGGCRTTVSNLSSSRLDGTQNAAFSSKVDRVRQWTSDFVGVVQGRSNVGVTSFKRRHQELPPDTQED